jgi:signal transduction histidine kinase/ActR/RegA family two-component response regulator
MFNNESKWRNWLVWTDRFLPGEIREDPILQLRCQLALFFALPGSVVSLALLGHAASLSTKGVSQLLPFFIGQAMCLACSFALMNRRTIKVGLYTMGFVTTAMVIYASYISGGFSNVTMAWFVVTPVLLTLLAGNTVAIIGSGLCVAALFAFLSLENAGHEFPLFVEQSPLLWVTVVGYGVATVCGITTYSQRQFQLAVGAYRSEIDRRKRVEQTLRHAQQRLRIAKGAAEAGADAKGAFLAQVSHEIRNPLTAIMGTIDLLELPAEPTLRAARIDLLRQSAHSLLELVDDVLDFSKIESNRIEFNPRPINPIFLIEELERAYRPQVMEKGLELYLEIDPDLEGDALIDPLRVRQVLANLMSNALKFTTEGSITLEVSKGEMDGRPVITFGVEDTGIGIPEEAHTQIFQPYVQAERSTTEQYGGTGLGLPICSRLITLMDGQLGFETEVGEGTRFWFSLPTDTASEIQATKEPTSNIPGRTHILVVEDDPLNRQVVGELLESLGHRVTLASGGVAGVENYQNEQPDLVLMDVQMPDINGMIASQQIRIWEAEHRLQPVPILAMTADVEVHRIARYGESGMNDLLGKPVNREKLQNAVTGWAVRRQPGPDSAP